MAYVEGGGAYYEMLELGIEDETARSIAKVVGIINAAIEMGQWATVAKTVPGASAFIRAGVKLSGTTLAKQIAEKGISKGIIADLLKIGAKLTLTGTAEITQEVVQENVTVLGAEIGKNIENKAREAGIPKITTDEYLRRMKDIVESSLGMFLVGVPGGAVETGRAVENYSRDKRILAENENAEDVDGETISAEELAGKDFTDTKALAIETYGKKVKATFDFVTSEEFTGTPEQIENITNSINEMTTDFANIEQEYGAEDVINNAEITEAKQQINDIVKQKVNEQAAKLEIHSGKKAEDKKVVEPVAGIAETPTTPDKKVAETVTEDEVTPVAELSEGEKPPVSTKDVELVEERLIAERKRILSDKTKTLTDDGFIQHRDTGKLSKEDVMNGVKKIYNVNFDEFDLDDGVTVNYAKFEGAVAKI
jgi:hypothetical protein